MRFSYQVTSQIDLNLRRKSESSSNLFKSMPPLLNNLLAHNTLLQCCMQNNVEIKGCRNIFCLKDAKGWTALVWSSFEMGECWMLTLIGTMLVTCWIWCWYWHYWLYTTMSNYHPELEKWFLRLNLVHMPLHLSGNKEH